MDHDSWLSQTPEKLKYHGEEHFFFTEFFTIVKKYKIRQKSKMKLREVFQKYLKKVDFTFHRNR